MNRRILENTAAFILCAVIMVFFCTEFFLNLTPPISRDALIHHLAVPKLWLNHGGFYEIPWAEYSYYPMYINLLYIICLYFKNDIAPKFIHLAFGLGTGWVIYFYLKQKFDRNWGLLGMVIFLTTPIVVWLSTSAYIDLGMTFFTTASVLAFVKWRDSKYGQ
ncbi:MAG: phospholipid carrier-dependent glycosyltransferase, partial [Deltaproteobacteria bacterium]|nr:phospholipid carrier-dependent glycosyltransferase [Deltaproteobacteria bacterium]